MFRGKLVEERRIGWPVGTLSIKRKRDSYGGLFTSPHYRRHKARYPDFFFLDHKAQLIFLKKNFIFVRGNFVKKWGK